MAGRSVRVTLDHACEDVRDVLAGKRLTPREHFKEHRAKRPDVGALVDRFPTSLLRTPYLAERTDLRGNSRIRQTVRSVFKADRDCDRGKDVRLLIPRFGLI